MEVIKLTPDQFERWDQFCLSNSEAWFWHTTPYLKYQEAYRPSAKTKVFHSMFIRDNKLVAICPLAEETIQNGSDSLQVYSLGEEHLQAPVIADNLHPDDRDRVRREVFSVVGEWAKSGNIARIQFQDNVLTPRFLEPKIAPSNIFEIFGYLDQSIGTQIIDLRRTEEELWRQVRKSYHSLINKADGTLEFQLLDSKSITKPMFDEYQQLHKKAAGRITRPQETFDWMRKWVESGTAVLGQVLKDGKVIGCALVNVYKFKAYYKSACNDPEWESELPLGHLIQWKMIRSLKKMGVTHYELGMQFPGPSFSHVPSKEEQRISFFKHAFGGVTAPFQRGVKYFNADLCQHELSACANAISDFIREK